MKQSIVEIIRRAETCFKLFTMRKHERRNSISDEIQIYVKASNLLGTMEGTIKRKNWDEIRELKSMVGK